MLRHLLDSTTKLCSEESAKCVIGFQVSVQSRLKRLVTLHGPFKLGQRRIIFLLDDGAFLTFCYLAKEHLSQRLC
jgi:hypothetical protein